MSDPNKYFVGWICAIKTEVVAARSMLDETYDDGPESVATKDNNSYTLGRVGKHNVVIASLPFEEYGITSAATVARDMVHSFPNVRIGLMVGIGGGAPSASHDIRLGDVVVSSDVFQYDYGKMVQEQDFQPTGRLDQPPTVLRSAVTNLQATHEMKGAGLDVMISQALSAWPRLRSKYQRPPAESDILFHPNVIHDPLRDCSNSCAHSESSFVCRPKRGEYEDDPAIHYGKIASANQLMKDEDKRDKLARGGVLCFEMEAAGLMNHFPCIVIRGICDYADTHKNNDWHGYAAMAAAAYAKQLLARIPPNRLESEKKMADILGLVQTRIEKIDSRLRDKGIYDWLQPPDPSTNYNNACDERHPGSGSWLLQHETFLSWETVSQSSFLWLHGISGCGKTVLSSKVIEYLSTSGTDSPVLYFYFDFRDEKKQRLEHLLRHLVNQLGSLRNDCQGLLRSLFSSCDDGTRQPSFKELWELTSAMFKSAREVWIVLDALDESTSKDNNNNLLVWLGETACTDNATIRLVATSRPEEYIRSAIDQMRGSALQLSVQGPSIDQDISTYLRFRLQNDTTISKWRGRADLKADIEAKVLSGCDGMFRLVACRLNSLKDCLSEYDLQQMLQRLPKDLNDAYDRMVVAIPRGYLPVAVRILQFLLFSARPLTAMELSHAIAVETDNESYFNPAKCLIDEREIAHYCPGLTMLLDRSISQQEPVLQLAHLSIKEYLNSDLLAPELKTYLNKQSANSTLTNICVSYLSHISEQLKDMEATKYLIESQKLARAKLENKYSFALHCSQEWYVRAKARSGDADQSRSKIIHYLKETHSTIYLWLHRMDSDWGQTSDKPASVLYYASFIGLLDEVKELIAQDANVNTEGGFYGNAVQAASYRGYQDIVRTLLDAGAEVNAQCGDYGNALQAASDTGHQVIVRMLLDAGAEVNMQYGPYGNALQAASRRGQRDIVELLLRAGADVNAQGGLHRSALQAASSWGRRDVVELLLRAGADASVMEGFYGDALQAASRWGQRDVDKLLPYAVGLFDTYEGNWSGAIQIALRKNRRDVAELLLRASIEGNIRRSFYGNATPAASRWLRRDMIEHLLRDYEATDDAYRDQVGFALQAASKWGRRGIVWLQRRAGEDENTQGGSYTNAPQNA